jgi:MFS family permease
MPTHRLTIAMRARTPDPRRLALFWLGVQAVWGALLGISLQARTIELSHENPLIAYGRLATAGALAAAMTQVLVGVWSDARRQRGSRRIEFYLAGAIAGALTIAWFYGARTFVELSAAFVALQIALNIAIGPYQAVIPDVVERARVGLASAWMAALQSAGNAIGALAASFIVNARALSATLAALLLGSCAVTCAHLRTLEFPPPPQPAPVRVTRAFVDLFISRALVYIGFYTLLGYLLFYVRAVLATSAGSSAREETGILIVGFTVVGAIGAALSARPADRLDKRLVATLGGSGFIAGLGLFIWTHAWIGAAVATLLAGLGWGAFLVADWAIACRVLPPAAMATSMGLWNIAIVLAQIVAPAFTTAVLQHFGLATGAQGPRTALALALGESLLGVAWLWRLPSCVIGE